MDVPYGRSDWAISGGARACECGASAHVRVPSFPSSVQVSHCIDKTLESLLKHAKSSLIWATKKGVRSDGILTGEVCFFIQEDRSRQRSEIQFGQFGFIKFIHSSCLGIYPHSPRPSLPIPPLVSVDPFTFASWKTFPLRPCP